MKELRAIFHQPFNHGDRRTVRTQRRGYNAKHMFIGDAQYSKNLPSVSAKTAPWRLGLHPFLPTDLSSHWGDDCAKCHLYCVTPINQHFAACRSNECKFGAKPVVPALCRRKGVQRLCQFGGFATVQSLRLSCGRATLPATQRRNYRLRAFN
jgi:hypothetical protein